MRRKKTVAATLLLLLTSIIGTNGYAQQTDDITTDNDETGHAPTIELLQINRAISGPLSAKPELRVRIDQTGAIIIAERCAPARPESLPSLAAGEHLLPADTSLKPGENRLVICYYTENHPPVELAFSLIYDNIPPKIQLTPPPGRYRIKQNVKITCSDTLSGCASLNISGDNEKSLTAENPGTLELNIGKDEQRSGSVKLRALALDAAQNKTELEAVYDYSRRFRLNGALGLYFTAGELADPIPLGVGGNLAFDARPHAILWLDRYLTRLTFIDFWRAELQYAYFANDPSYMEHFTFQSGALKDITPLADGFLYAGLQAGFSFLQIKRDPQSALSLTFSSSFITGYRHLMKNDLSLFGQLRFSYIADMAVPHYSLGLEVGGSYAF